MLKSVAREHLPLARVAKLVAVVTWVVAIPYGAWQLGQAAYLSIVPPRGAR